MIVSDEIMVLFLCKLKRFAVGSWVFYCMKLNQFRFYWRWWKSCIIFLWVFCVSQSLWFKLQNLWLRVPTQGIRLGWQSKLSWWLPMLKNAQLIQTSLSWASPLPLYRRIFVDKFKEKTEKVFFFLGEFFNAKVQVFPVISYKNVPLGLYVIAGNPFLFRCRLLVN